MKFKPGDRVKCITDFNTYFILNQIYTVISVEDMTNIGYYQWLGFVLNTGSKYDDGKYPNWGSCNFTLVEPLITNTKRSLRAITRGEKQ